MNYLPLQKALLWIALSVLLISGSGALALCYYRHVKAKQRVDPAYKIVAIVQTSADAEQLKTTFLAELLQLSIDRPKNLYQFNSREGERKLLGCPCIKEATIKKIRPGTLHIRYALRKPIAILGDYSNTLIDAEAVTFPLNPFFTPKRLPVIYLGMDNETPFEWGISLKGKEIELAFRLLNFILASFNNSSTTLFRLDVSKAFALSYGQQQIVIEIEEHEEKMIDGKPAIVTFSRVLRLGTNNFEKQLANYLVLRQHLKDNLKKVIVDLRLYDLAFIFAYE